nr:hypothetical protein [Tanacetum cinerariifolium]
MKLRMKIILDDIQMGSPTPFSPEQTSNASKSKSKKRKLKEEDDFNAKIMGYVHVVADAISALIFFGGQSKKARLLFSYALEMRKNVKMNDLNNTMEEYIRLKEEKARRRDVHDLISVETEFPAMIFNDALSSEVALSCESTVSPLNNNQIDFRISFDESDDEDYTIIYDKNSFSYKIISVNDLKTGLENNNDKVNLHSFSSSEPTVSYFDDFDYFKDFENEFSVIAYNDALTSKLDLSKPTVSPQHINEFNETSLSECNGEEQNVIYFNDLFPFNVIYPDDLSDKDNDNDKINIEHSSGDLSIETLPNVIKNDTQGSNKLL